MEHDADDIQFWRTGECARRSCLGRLCQFHHGSQPINELEMAYVFQESVASVLPAQYLTTLTFVVTINGTITAPSAGTSIIPGDPESYFSCAANAVTVTQ